MVDDPLEALAILVRVSEGVYLPGDLPAKSVALEDRPTWFLACRVTE